MLSLLFILLIIFVPVTVYKLSSYRFEVPHPFACGADDICYCSKAPDCKKREGKEKQDS